MSIGSAGSEIYIIFYSEGEGREGEEGERDKKKSNQYREMQKEPPPPQSHTFTSKHAESRAAYKVHSHGKIKAGVTQSMLDAAAKKREENFFFFWKEFN